MTTMRERVQVLVGGTVGGEGSLPGRNSLAGAAGEVLASESSRLPGRWWSSPLGQLEGAHRGRVMMTG